MSHDCRVRDFRDEMFGPRDSISRSASEWFDSLIAYHSIATEYNRIYRYIHMTSYLSESILRGMRSIYYNMMTCVLRSQLKSSGDYGIYISLD